MGSALAVLLVLALLGWVVWTMPVGQRIASRLGLVGFGGQGARKQDREYLLRVCGGDRARVQRLLDEARAGDIRMSDAEAHRRAIRRHLRSKHGGRVA